jgi:hypothetical protein
MFPAVAGITFAATIEQPKCPALNTMTDNTAGVSIAIQCELVHGHRQKRHQYTASMLDDTLVEIYWTKKRSA